MAYHISPSSQIGIIVTRPQIFRPICHAAHMRTRESRRKFIIFSSIDIRFYPHHWLKKKKKKTISSYIQSEKKHQTNAYSMYSQLNTSKINWNFCEAPPHYGKKASFRDR